MPNWKFLGFFIAMVGFGACGSLIMDTAVFLEYLPSSKKWPLTALAFAGFLTWGFLVSNSWNCSDGASCTKANNWGWRYTIFTGGALVFVMSVLRVTVIKLEETPKYLLGVGDESPSTYLANKGAIFHQTQFETWRNYALTNISGIPGSIVAGCMCNTKLGRKFAMVIDLTLTCVIAFCINIYYGTLSQDTPEVLPSAHRATGNSIAVACNRIMGIISAVVASKGNTGTPALSC
ncbi:putative MFS-type transporter [Colletotrichum siamense]|uniref:MFS-type transporter n=1 Tax=Colletotrichum siamense TaxID=690259 RepID=A0A9P5EYW6_COLSI|nr:putative MFS-type transporter [Colletotrichum siamense]KAF4862323.1 putative MFS-type transporter [Colletotrichum siamense]